MDIILKVLSESLSAKFMFNLAGIPLIAIQTALENHYFAEH